VDPLGADPLRRTPGAGRFVRAALLAWLAVVLAGGIAFAQAPADVPAVVPPDASPADATLTRLLALPARTACTETGAAVEIAGVGRAVYDAVAFDGAAGTATLRGGVCIDVSGGSVRLRAERVDLAGLDGPDVAVVSAVDVRLEVAGWRLGVGVLEGPIDDLTMAGVVVLGPGVVGLADVGRLASDELGLERVALATPAYLIEAAQATLDGGDLVLQRASATSCACGVERYRLFGSEVRSALDGGPLRVEEPRLRTLGLTIPLGERLTLRADGSDLELPVTVEARDDLGTVAVLRTRAADGTRLELGASTGEDAFPLASLRVAPDGALAEVAFDARGLDLGVSRDHELAGGAIVTPFVRADLQRDEPLLRNGVEVRSPVWTGGGDAVRATASARAALEVAAEPERTVAAGRLPLRAEATATVPLAARLEVEGALRGDATAYLGLADPPAPGQAALTATLRLRAGGPGASLDAFATRRVVAGASPFAFDAASEQARVGVEVDLTLGPAAAWARAEWRLAPEAPGAEHLEALASLTLLDHPGWRAVAEVEADIAALVAGPVDEDWLEARLLLDHDVGVSLSAAYRWAVAPWAPRSLTLVASYDPRRDARLSLRAVRDLDAGAWTSLRAAAAWPLALQAEPVSITLVPRLEVELAPWATGAADRPGVLKHGATLILSDCCGTLRLGYLSEDEGGVTIDVGLALPPLRLEDLPSGELPPLPPAYGGAP
jgi:hypothetical protein